MTDVTPPDVRACRPAELSGLRAWVAESGGPSWSPALWERMFAGAPDEGRGRARVWVATVATGAPVAAQAGIAVRVLQRGERATWELLCDPWGGDPDVGDGARDGGLALEAAARAFVAAGEREAEGASPILVALAGDRAWRRGLPGIRHEIVRNQNALEAAPGAVRLGDAEGCAVEEVDAFPEEIAELAVRAAERHGALFARDAAQLAWRYLDHPEHVHRVALCRDGAGSLAGYAVLRRGSLDGLAGLWLADWLVPEGDGAAAHALRAWLVERARAEGAGPLLALFPETCEEWLAFQRAGFRVRPTRRFCVARTRSRAADDRWLYWNWYYTLGDLVPW